MNFEIAPLNTQYANNGCIVCRNDFLDEKELLALACGHLFHSHCVEPWLKNHRTCPTCRTKVDILPIDLLKAIIENIEEKKNSKFNRYSGYLFNLSLGISVIELVRDTARYLTTPSPLEEEDLEQNPHQLTYPYVLVTCYVLLFAATFFAIQNARRKKPILNIPIVVTKDKDNYKAISYHTR